MSSAEEGMKLAGELIKAGKDDANVSEAGRQAGAALLTAAKFVNNALLPIAMVNYGFEKAKTYFLTKFSADMEKKIAEIPGDKLRLPRTTVAGPALQGLAFSHDEANLREMYLKLLASEMDLRSDVPHPAFVEIIRQLSPTEAPLLRTALKSSVEMPLVEVRSVDERKAYSTLFRNLVDVTDETGTPVEDHSVPIMVDNWSRLELVNITFTGHVSVQGAYDYVERRPEVIEARRQLLREIQAGRKFGFHIQKGFLQRTSFGCAFAQATGLLDDTGPQERPLGFTIRKAP